MNQESYTELDVSAPSLEVVSDEGPGPSFDELGISTPTIRALAKRDIHGPFKIQTMVMADALAGRDVLAKSRTGSGKTLAFAIPIVERLKEGDKRPAALILVPTRELASQVANEFNDIGRPKGLHVAAAYGGVSVRDQAKAVGRAHIVVATPGRLEDLASRNLISLDKVQVFVLDEADRMMDMGFQPQVDRIVRRLPKQRHTMFFSATLDGQIGRLAKSYTNDAILHEVKVERQTVEEVDHAFVPVTVGNKVEALARILKEDHGLSLVFVRTKRGADRLVYKLKANGVKALAMHGDLTQAARQKALKRFDTGDVKTLVATDVAARGLDLDDIARVINYDPPEDEKSYVHRVGRTARAGRSGLGITFVLPSEMGDVGRTAARLNLHDEFQAEGMTIAPPQIVYSSRNGRKARGRRRRR